MIYHAENSSNVASLAECSTCGQVTLLRENDTHAETHLLDTDFPQL